MNNRAIIYAIDTNDGQLIKVGTYTKDIAIRMTHDPDLIRIYGNLVAINCDDGEILHQYIVHIINPRTNTVVGTESFWDITSVHHFEGIMTLRGYKTYVRHI